MLLRFEPFFSFQYFFYSALFGASPSRFKAFLVNFPVKTLFPWTDNTFLRTKTGHPFFNHILLLLIECDGSRRFGTYLYVIFRAVNIMGGNG